MLLVAIQVLILLFVAMATAVLVNSVGSLQGSIESQQDIIESVDSICRDSADTQYMLIQTNFSKSPKLLTCKPL